MFVPDMQFLNWLEENHNTIYLWIFDDSEHFGG